jgi:hypothetical protein
MYPSSYTAKGLHHAIQSLQLSLPLDHSGALEGEDVHLHSQGGLRIGECSKLLNKIANEKKRYCI